MLLENEMRRNRGKSRSNLQNGEVSRRSVRRASPTAFSHLLCNDPWGLSAPHPYISCATHQRNFAVQLSPQVSSPNLQHCVRELRRSAPHGPPSQAARRSASDALARISAPCRGRPTRPPQPALSAVGALCLRLSGSWRSCCRSFSVRAPGPVTSLRHSSLERSARAVFRSSTLVAVAAPSPPRDANPAIVRPIYRYNHAV